MKIDRLIGILSILLQKETVTAPYLAEKFEVSRRTINRDMEDLCKAGIPIVTRQGANGGISVMDNYKIDRALLTRTEMQDILAGLKGLDSINGTNRYAKLMEKLSAGSWESFGSKESFGSQESKGSKESKGSSDFLTGSPTILIDLSSWYKASLVPKIELIRDAIQQERQLTFCYFSPKGETRRSVDPYYLIFRWSSWYVWGFCSVRQAFRLFKLNRMEELCLTGAKFTRRPVPFPDMSNERIFPGGIRVKALFEPECKWRLMEEFGRGCFEEQEDGRLLFHADYTDPENLVTWLLTFRERVILLEPEEIRQELMSALNKTLEQYKEEK